MRRNKYQDKYLKFILEHKQMTKLHKLWMAYWFLDRNGYAKGIGLIERMLGLAKGKTKSRITDPLQQMDVIKLVKEVYLGDPSSCKPTPVFDFTEAVENIVKDLALHDDVTISHVGSLTRHFYGEERPDVTENSQGDHNNKRTKETKDYQSFDDFTNGEILDLSSFDKNNSQNNDQNEGGEEND